VLSATSIGLGLARWAIKGLTCSTHKKKLMIVMRMIVMRMIVIRMMMIVMMGVMMMMMRRIDCDDDAW